MTNGYRQNAVLSVHHACVHTLASSAAAKFIENERGVAFVQMVEIEGGAQ